MTVAPTEQLSAYRFTRQASPIKLRRGNQPHGPGTFTGWQLNAMSFRPSSD